MKVITDRPESSNVFEVAAAVMAAQINTVYDADEFTVDNGETDYDVSAERTDAFSNITKAHNVTIRINGTVV